MPTLMLWQQKVSNLSQQLRTVRLSNVGYLQLN